MDTPTQRMLKVGKATIGLVGLDIALNTALAQKLSPKEAVESIYQAIQEKNYIAEGAANDYKKALEREYRSLLGEEQEPDQDLVIRIFGTGCISCNGLQDEVIDAMMRAGIAADIDMIHDRDEIGRHGIMATPALMINGQVKSAGIHPTPVQLEAWLLEAAGEKK
ncbi:MAG: thioredoxin family protein [Proteobacteria bacterium]|nr:thioredoxin family protein [Pseudomonadota bacterium]MBU1060290.1 thioredoxin family protein [Pseudomonadota bacterium]